MPHMGNGPIAFCTDRLIVGKSWCCIMYAVSWLVYLPFLPSVIITVNM